MATTIEVSLDQLRSTATTIKEKAEDYETQYNNLYKAMDEMGDAWAGKDNQAFINQIRGFQDDFQKMHQLMLDYADFLEKTAQAYQTTQDNITTAAGKLTN